MAEKKIQLLDGAMGTQIWARTGEHKPVWIYNIENPEVVKEVHRAYIEAGADIILTNTFGANRHAIAKGCSYSVAEVVSAGVSIARQAAKGTAVKVALDIGPLLDLLEPYGDLTEDDATDIFTEQIGAGMNGEEKPDMIVLETFMDLEMMKVAVKVAKSYGVPVLSLMTFEQAGRTLMGQSVEDVAHALSSLGVDALGMNCSLGPDTALPIIASFREHTTLPLVLKPNAGKPIVGKGGAVTFPTSPSDFAKDIEAAFPYVDFVGGCCGTDAEYIKMLRDKMNQYT